MRICEGMMVDDSARALLGSVSMMDGLELWLWAGVWVH